MAEKNNHEKGRPLKKMKTAVSELVEYKMCVLPMTSIVLGYHLKHLSTHEGEGKSRCRVQFDVQQESNCALDIYFPDDDDMECFQDTILCWNNRKNILQINHRIDCAADVKEVVDVVILEKPTSANRKHCLVQQKASESFVALKKRMLWWKKREPYIDIPFILAVHETEYFEEEEEESEEDWSESSCEEDHQFQLKKEKKIIGQLFLGHKKTDDFDFEFKEGTRFELVTNVQHL